MPSTSAKQHRFMEAVAHNQAFAKKVGIPQSVGKDFSAADKGKKFGRGGMAAINKQNTNHGRLSVKDSCAENVLQKCNAVCHGQLMLELLMVARWWLVIRSEPLVRRMKLF